jgi:hypothetical protein
MLFHCHPTIGILKCHPRAEHSCYPGKPFYTREENPTPFLIEKIHAKDRITKNKLYSLEKTNKKESNNTYLNMERTQQRKP